MERVVFLLLLAFGIGQLAMLADGDWSVLFPRCLILLVVLALRRFMGADARGGLSLAPPFCCAHEWNTKQPSPPPHPIPCKALLTSPTFPTESLSSPAQPPSLILTSHHIVLIRIRTRGRPNPDTSTRIPTRHTDIARPRHISEHTIRNTTIESLTRTSQKRAGAESQERERSRRSVVVVVVAASGVGEIGRRGASRYGVRAAGAGEGERAVGTDVEVLTSSDRDVL